MKLKSKSKSAFVQPFSCMMLSIITGMGISPFVLAVPAKVSLQEPEQDAQTQPQKLARIPDGGSSEESEFLQKANALYNQGDFKGAEENLRQFLKKSPEDAFGHFQLGNVLFQQKRLDEAISAYRETIRLEPKYALAYNAIGMIYASQSRWEEAITEYKKALEINPNYGDALTNFALALWQTNKKDEALSSLEKAINIFKSQNRNEKVNQVEQILRQIKTAHAPNVS